MAIAEVAKLRGQLRQNCRLGHLLRVVGVKYKSNNLQCTNGPITLSSYQNPLGGRGRGRPPQGLPRAQAPAPYMALAFGLFFKSLYNNDATS